MATDPLAMLQPDKPLLPEPGFFDGQIPAEDVSPDPMDENIEVAGPIGAAVSKIAKPVGEFIEKVGDPIAEGIGDLGSKLFLGESGAAMRDARRKILDPERTKSRIDRSDPRIEAPKPEPIMPELSDLATMGQPPADLPGNIPSRFETPDYYERYIYVGDEAVDAVLGAPKNREELLQGGLSDFNSEKIIDEAGIQERIEATSQQFAGKISEDKRDVITHQATQQLADVLGMSPAKLTRAMLARKKGQGIEVEGAGMAETMLAAKNLLISEMKKLDEIALRAETGSLEDLAQFRYQFELVANLQRNYKGAQTEIARTLSSMRIEATGTPGDPGMAAEFAARRKRDLTAMLSDYGGAEDIRKLAALYGQTGDPHKKSAFLRGVAKARATGDAVFEIWQHALLTNPVSQIKNLIGGFATMFTSNVELLGAASIGTARRAFGGEGGATFGDLNAKVFGQTMAMWTAMKYASRSFARGQSVLPGSKIDTAHSRPGSKFSPAFSGEAFGASTFSTFIDLMGELATGGRVAFRFLEAGDTFYKVLAMQGSMWEDALSTGRARGLKGEELSDWMADFINDPPAYAMDRAEAEAKYLTLQQDLDSAGAGLQAFRNDVPFLRWVTPFFKTPYNSFKWAFVDRTPLGLFWGDTAMKMKKGGKARDEALARITIGTSVGAMIGFGLAGNTITGGGPSTPEGRATWRRMNIQPYSVKIGDKYYSYAGTEPLSSVIGIWADVAEIYASGQLDETKKKDLWAAALAGTAYNMTNKSFMQGFATLIEATSDPDRYAKGLTENFVRSIVPRFVAQMERIDDPVLREARDYIDEIKAQIPGLSKSLKPVVDLWGRDRFYGIPDEHGEVDGAVGPDWLSPIYKSEYKPNIVDLEIKRMGVRIPRQEEWLNPGSQLKKPLRLTDEERYFYQKTVGQEAFKRLETFMKEKKYKSLKEESEKGNSLVTQRLSNNIRGIYNKARAFGLAQLIQHKTLGPAFLKRIEQIRNLEADEKREEMEAVQ